MRSIKNLGLVLALLVFLASCNDNKKAEKVNKDKEMESVDKVYPVRIQKIQTDTVSRTLEYSANLTAFKEIHYAPASPGRIDKINVEVGSRVRIGQILVEMDKTQLGQAATQLENAKYNYNRIDTLYQLGSISEQQYEQTKTQYELALSNYTYLKENTTLLSPVNGIITGKYFENGELYSGAPNTAAGKAAVISLMQIDPLKAIVSISQSYYADVKEGMKAEITTDILKGNIFQGTVSKVYPTIDPATRTFKVEIIIKNNDEKLRPGMYADIEINFKEAEALVVPAIAVLKQDGTNNRYVFINENGIARQVEVKVGKRFDDKIELIANGIKENDDLIIEGQANLLNGSKIKVITD